MILTKEEKSSITQLKPDEMVRLDDETRGMYQFEVEKVSPKEYRVSKFAIMCLDIKYFSKPEEVIDYIQN